MVEGGDSRVVALGFVSGHGFQPCRSKLAMNRLQPLSEIYFP